MNGVVLELPRARGFSPYAEWRGWVVYRADVLRWLDLQEPGSGHLIVCDPPYHRILGATWDRQWKTDADYLQWVASLVKRISAVMHGTGSLYLFASAVMASRVELAVAGCLAVLNHVVWDKRSLDADRVVGRAAGSEKGALRRYFPNSERIIFAEHANSDGVAMSGAGYTLACDHARGFVMEPLRVYLDDERKRAGVSKAQVATYFAARGWPKYVTARHAFSRSQWALPTEENYQRLRECLEALGRPRGEYLRRDYEDLRRDYEDLRRPLRLTAERPYTDVWVYEPVAWYEGKHQAEKPSAMARDVVAASARAGAAVWDLCAGSAPFAVAAVRAGLPAIAVEEDPRWCAIAAERLRTAEEEIYA